jgi:hypothetical protein
MPALTAAQISQQLGQYIEPGGDFLAALNQVLPRVYSMGFWRDTMYEIQLDAGNGYVSLPEDTESVLSATVDNLPRPVRNMWHDIRMIGRQEQVPGYYGLIDLGYSPVAVDLTTAYGVTDEADLDFIFADGFSIFRAGEQTELTLEEVAGSTIEVKALNSSTGQFSTGNIGLNGDGPDCLIVFDNETFQRVLSVSYSDLPFDIDVRVTFDNVDYTTIASLPAGSGVTQFRRFKVTDARTDSVVTLLVKRKAPYLTSGEGIVHLGNINALKHALLGRIAEDNADVQRANYHWGVCKQMLEEELDASRGSARPMIQLSGFGEGASRPFNLY